MKKQPEYYLVLDSEELRGPFTTIKEAQDEAFGFVDDLCLDTDGEVRIVEVVKTGTVGKRILWEDE